MALSWEGLGGSWAHLGLSWAPVGSSWAHLGASWVPLGRLLGVPGALLAVSGAPLGPLARLLGDLGFILMGFRKGLGGFGKRSGPQNNCSFVFQRTSPLNIKIQLSASPKMQDHEFPSFFASFITKAITTSSSITSGMMVNTTTQTLMP